MECVKCKMQMQLQHQNATQQIFVCECGNQITTDTTLKQAVTLGSAAVTGVVAVAGFVLRMMSDDVDAFDNDAVA